MYGGDMVKRRIHSTKDLCDLFQIGRETLRHYERLGLLNPRINPDNGYREYEYWDVGALIDILKLRSEGLSLAETKEIMYNQDYSTSVEMLYAREDYYEKIIQHYRLLQKKTKRDVEYLSVALDHLFEIAEVPIDDLYFVPYTIDKKDKSYKDMQKAFQNVQFFTSAIQIYDEDLENEDEPFLNYGLLSEKEYVDYLGIKEGIVIPKSTVICEMIDLVGKNRVRPADIADFVKVVKRDYPNDGRPIYAVMMARFHDIEKRYHQYLFVFKQI
jgi:DNA-binding transcriptional MerR regulator